ncbi:MAG: nucleotide pyrophosphohydrolase [Rhodocyclaceae bacterium]|nr:nucleotide pyrophosphohydrolase [Rhodocyclaceae bacterium]
MAEHFQWLTAEESQSPQDGKRGKSRDELADVLIYLVELADTLDVDRPPPRTTRSPRTRSSTPVDKARGNALKYDEL